MFHGKYPAGKWVTLASGERVTQPGPWLDLIHHANGVDEGLFGEPTSVGPWWAGGSVEEYPDARVIHHDDGREPMDRSVSVVALTQRGHDALTEADRLLKES